jgi:GIY-YIG catalytic domain
MSKTVFIYALVSERDGYTLPWYVGQTVDVDVRLYDLVRDCDENETEQALWTRGEKTGGYNIEMRILEETVKDSAHEREAYWIAQMRAVNAGLRNSTRGNAHTNRKQYLIKKQAQQRQRISADAVWLAQILKRLERP